MLDDSLLSRRRAERLSIPYPDTLGVIVAAKLSGMVPSTRAVIEDVRKAGLSIA